MRQDERAPFHRRFHVSVRQRVRVLLRALGPGLVSGAADDDPSGIATYSQAGAQYGFGMLWTMLLTTPLMIAIQLVSARIGRVTGRGLAGNLRRHYPRPIVVVLVLLLVAANTLNISADISAMGEALQLIVGGGEHGHAIVFGIVLAALQVRLPYRQLAALFQWLCFSLLAYVAVLFLTRVHWNEALVAFVVPHFRLDFDSLMMIVAVLGTTISPYLFFWQASQEVEEMKRKGGMPLLGSPTQAPVELLRIRVDTVSGMVFSNVISLAIMLSAAATLHAAGIRDIESATQAAQALRPFAGDRATLIFALGVIGTGMLAVPVLAGSAAYAASDAFGWRTGLDKGLMEAREFYVILIGATLIGTLIDFTRLSPIKALFYSAVANGVVAVPVMAMLVILGSNVSVMGEFAVKGALRTWAWIATAVMTLAVALMAYAAARG